MVRPEWIEQHIYLIRGQRVMLSHDLAQLYQVRTKALIQAVKRNPDRFPEDFMFPLESQEFTILRSQFVTSRWGGVRRIPYAFTEHGIAMLASILSSPRAIRVNIEIIRTFINLRKLLHSHKELSEKLNQLELKYDHQFKLVFDAIRELIAPPEPKRRKMGFHADEDD